MTAGLDVTRPQTLAFRRRVSSLDERLPPGSRSLRRAAWAGLQDSMPRAASLSIHARVAETGPSGWEHPSLVQIWGPRFHAYTIAARDLGIFTRGLYPEDARSRQVAEEMAARLHGVLAGATMTYGEAGERIGENPNRLRYASSTGRVLIRWDGARQPTVWTAPAPEVDPAKARLELARRYLHVFGPATPDAFAAWAGFGNRWGAAVFAALRRSLTPVRTPIGDAWILSRDEPALRAAPGPTAPARFLPSGDTFTLGADRELVVPDAGRRGELWTPRVWPGALLVDGDIAGTWRRTQGTVAIWSWRRLSRASRDAVEAEAESLPLPGVRGRIVVRWGA